jgi:hypothetical protein
MKTSPGTLMNLARQSSTTMSPEKLWVARDIMGGLKYSARGWKGNERVLNMLGWRPATNDEVGVEVEVEAATEAEVKVRV